MPMSRRDAAGRVTSTVVAAVSVVAIAAALVAFVVDGSGDDSRVAAEEPSAQTSAEAPAPSDSPAESEPAPADATTETSAPQPKPDKKDKKPAKKQPEPQPEPEPEPAVPSAYVEVYNMTSVSGLASSKAAQLQDAGWQVVGIDNWRGNIPASTVYYPDGMADAATQLANTLGIGRTRGAVAPMKFDRLTVILTADAT